MKKIYFLLLALSFTTLGLSQVTIYEENFTGQNGKGAIAGAFNSLNTDLSGVDWTIDISSATLSANFFGGNEDYFYVTSEAFAGKDTDGNAFWLSPSISIADYSNVSFSFDASTSGNNDNTDTFLTQYRINGGTWTTAATNGNLNNDFNLVVSQTGLTGSTLEIRIRVNNNSDNEITTFDNILVEGVLLCTSITGLTIDSFATTSANISWTTGDSETNWEIAVQSAGTGEPVGAGTPVATNSFTDNTLTALTSYEVYVRADCTNNSNGLSQWVGPVNFTTLSACPDITGLTIDSFTSTSANISWTAGGSEAGWEIAVQSAGTGEPVGAGTPVITNSFIGNSLSASTAYEVYVRADCSNNSNGLSQWVGPVNFMTSLQGTIGITCPSSNSTNIYTAEFDTVDSWTGDINGGNGDWEIPNDSGSAETGPDSAFSGNGFMNYEASGNTTATASAIRAIDLSNAIDANLSFYLHAYGAGMGTLNVGVSTTGSGGTYTNLFTQVGQIQTSESDPWIPVGIDLGSYAGQTIHIRFNHTGTGNYRGDMSIDYLRVDGCDSLCPSPNNIVVSNISGTSADITWDAGGSETDWEIVVQSAGTGIPGGSGTATTSNTHTASSLTQLTAYEVYVRADCDINGFSNWAGPINFTTVPINDDFANATLISCGNIYTGDTTLATIDEVGAPDVSTVEPDTDTDNDSPNVWFHFIGTGNPVTLSTCANTGFDTEILIFTGTSGNLTNIAEGYDECSNTTYEAEVTFNSVYGTPYSISVEGWNSGDTGTFELSVTCTTPAPNTYTFTNGSWDGNGNPNGVSTVNDDILITSGNATISSNTICNNTTVNAGAGLTVDSGITLTVANVLALESNSTSYSSLILDGIVAGTMTYDRHVNINGTGSTGSNDLISAPLTGEAFNTFAAANPNILSNSGGTLYLFGPFEKVTGQYVTWANTETSTLDPGVGYRAGSVDNGTFTFTGTANNGVVTNNLINSGSNNAIWNLVGNPYPSYLNVWDFLGHDLGDGTANIDLFDAGTAAIYGYDGSHGNGWTIYNLANTTASTVIAPGQGFMVSANPTNVPLYDLEFTPSMRRTGTSDDFIVGRNAELIYAKINLTTSSNSYSTEVYFNNNSSLGFDLGYDAKVWGGTPPDFAIYSHLIQDNTGNAIALQSLDMTNLLEVTIPLGVNANQGEQLTFSIADMTLPETVKVYLDDTLANTSTLLNNSDYVITPNTNLSGTGRFYLRTSEDALSTIKNNLDTLNIFALNSSNEIVVNGQLKENTVLDLYDIQGRKVLSTKLDDSNLENRIDVSSLNSGVYVVNVKNNAQQKSQKLVIN